MSSLTENPWHDIGRVGIQLTGFGSCNVRPRSLETLRGQGVLGTGICGAKVHQRGQGAHTHTLPEAAFGDSPCEKLPSHWAGLRYWGPT